MHPGSDAVRGAFRAEVLATTDTLVINQRLLSNNKAKSVDTPTTERPVPFAAAREPNDTLIEIDVVAANLSDLDSGCTGFAEGNEPRRERKQKSAGAFVADPLHLKVGEKARWFRVTSLNGRAKKIACRCDAEVFEFTKK
jgi:hypothetical protein